MSIANASFMFSQPFCVTNKSTFQPDHREIGIAVLICVCACVCICVKSSCNRIIHVILIEFEKILCFRALLFAGFQRTMAEERLLHFAFHERTKD